MVRSSGGVPAEDTGGRSRLTKVTRCMTRQHGGLRSDWRAWRSAAALGSVPFSSQVGSTTLWKKVSKCSVSSPR